MNKVAKDILMHIGMPRRSGRYPWGSGKDPYQSGDDFVGRVKKLRDSGMKETEIAKAVGCRNTTDLRVKYSAAVTARRRDRMEAARAMADDGKTHVMVSIYVEGDSQKPIIIGHRAEHLVQVKKKLRTAVNRIVGAKAKLELHVKVAKEWQSDPKQLERLGF